jgi:hypothetical protein
MKVGVIAAALLVITSTEASTQILNLSGSYRCVQGCLDGLTDQLAFITQHDWDLSLVNEAGMPSRAWIDRPGHIWIDGWHEGAVYSLDGMTVQFDRGTVWQRDSAAMSSVAPAPSVVTGSRVGARPASNAGVSAASTERAPTGSTAYDGRWSVVISTKAGGCEQESRYGVQIVNGSITTDASASAGVSGRVLRNGALTVRVSASGAQAVGVGRLSSTSGSGTWRGESSGESCTGVWRAARHG